MWSVEIGRHLGGTSENFHRVSYASGTYVYECMVIWLNSHVIHTGNFLSSRFLLKKQSFRSWLCFFHQEQILPRQSELSENVKNIYLTIEARPTSEILRLLIQS
jgi:hypothetical protein